MRHKRTPPRAPRAETPAGLAARRLALKRIDAVLSRGRAFDPAAGGGAALPPRDAAFAHKMAAAALRRCGQIDDLLARGLTRPADELAPSTRGVLRLGVAQLVFLDTPRHAAVDMSVRLARPAHKGLVNAVLRRIAAEGAAWRGAQDAARLNTPEWLWRSWRAAFGPARARAIAEVHLAEPPLDLSARGDPGDVARAVGGETLAAGTVRRPAGGRVEAIPGYAEGKWWVQDAAAALPARLLGARRGDAAIDLCAAPGGKTAQLAAAGVSVTAVENDPARLARLRGNLRRLGLDARLVRADAACWRPAAPARFVLLDAPCTATGAIRRHPDIPHIKRPGDAAAARARQDRLLDGAAAMLAPGGTLVYAVCSLQPEEGPQAIAALLARNPALARDPVETAEAGGLAALRTADGAVRTLPCCLAERGGMDGFYIARLKRKS